MPSAQESLMRAARAALGERPWARIRMAEVAAAAGVSRQTLYNEFGTKDGLGSALVERELEDFVDGAAGAATEAVRLGADPAVCCAAAAVWIVRTADRAPVVRAALTGCWGTWLPRPGLPPERLAARLRDRTVAVLGGRAVAGLAPPDAVAFQRACETGLRLALSYVVAPPRHRHSAGAPPDNAAAVHVTEVVRALLP